MFRFLLDKPVTLSSELLHGPDPVADVLHVQSFLGKAAAPLVLELLQELENHVFLFRGMLNSLRGALCK